MIMNQRLLAAIFIVWSLAACTQATISAPAETVALVQTATLTQTISPVCGIPTVRITPKVTATPQNFSLIEADEVSTLIAQFHPGVCAGLNLAHQTPAPADYMLPAKLTFTEVDALPDPNAWIIREIASNLDDSRQALISCQPDHCVDTIYIRDNDTGQVHIVDFNAMGWRPIQWLIWLNQDTFLVAQSANPHHGLFVAINVRTQSYEYYGLASDCVPSNLTP